MILFYIFIGIVVFVFIYDRATRSYLNPYKLIMVFGKKGSGKTTYLTKVALKNIRAGRKVYSTIYIPGTEMFNVSDIGTYTFPKGSVVLIDEVGMIWDNRDFKNFKPNVRDYFKFQRQYKNTVYLFSQTFDVDLKLRNLTDEMYLLKNVGRIFSVARKINKNITIQKGDVGKASCLVDDYVFSSIFEKNGIQFTFIPRYVDFFKSYDPKLLPNIESTYCDMSARQVTLVRTRDFIFIKGMELANRIALKMRYAIKHKKERLLNKVNKN